MSSASDKGFTELLAARILYQLCARGHVKMMGDTVDEVSGHVKAGQQLIEYMLHNHKSGERPSGAGSKS